jgi:hypothetical protein
MAQSAMNNPSKFSSTAMSGIDPSKLASMSQSAMNPLQLLGAVTGKMGEGATPCDKPPPPPPTPTPVPTPLQKTEKEQIEQNMVEWLKKSINSEGSSNPIVSGLATLLENNVALIDRIADKTLAKIKEKEAEAATEMPQRTNGGGLVKKRTKRNKRNKRKKRTKRRM